MKLGYEAKMKDASTQWLQRPEGRIAYDVDGEGPLVICMPGLGDLRRIYRFTAPALIDAGYRVARMDLRGHGESDASFSRYDGVATGEDAVALAEYLGGGAVLIGNSMSAGAAVWAAAERPGLVAGVVLVGPFVRNTPMNPLLIMLFHTLMMRPWARAAWTAYLPTLYAGRKPDDLKEHIAAIKASMSKPGYQKAFVRTTRTDHAHAEARLAGIATIPSLVVMGEQDPDFPNPAAEAQWIAGQISGEIVMVPEAGHYPQAQRPDLVNPALIAFLQKITANA